MYDDRSILLGPPFPLPVEEPFTLRHALVAGLTRRQLRELVRAAYLRRPVRGVYVASQLPDSLSLRARILGLVVPDGCFVCDRTAAWLHGAPAALAPNEHLSVPPVSCFRPSDEGRLRNPLSTSGERAVLARDLMELQGVLVTTPLRTALDLGRLQPTRDLRLSGMDAMLRVGGFTLDELLQEISRFVGQRGVVALRALAPLADGRAESPGESALRLRWYDAGLPRPEPQIPICINGREIFRLDLGLEELLFAAEYDGQDWHSSDEQSTHDEDRRDWMRTERRWQVEVFRKTDVYGPHQDADVRLRTAFLAARASLARRTYVI